MNQEPNLAQQVRQFVRGDLTWAELKGMTSDEAKLIARYGCELADAGLLKEARILFEGMVAMNPKDAAASAALGTVYEKLGLSQQARQAYEQALRWDSRHPVALTHRGVLRLRVGDAGGKDDLIAAVVAERRR
jgi:Flp pilus assembly protein TadD